MKDQRGQAVITATVFFAAVSFVLVFGIGNPLFNRINSTTTRSISKDSFFLAEAAVEDVAYRLKVGMDVDTTETLVLGASTATVEVADIADGKSVKSTGAVAGATRIAEIQLQEADGVAFFYGMQAHNGGILLENSASVLGNVYSNGPIEGANNMIYGNAVSAGPNGLIDGIHATGTARANTIQNSTVDIDAYYQTIDSTTVWGTEYPGSEDSPTTTLPITDDHIETWKTVAVAGGEKTCTDGKYTISDDETIGPVKIPCDLEVSGNIAVTFAGHVWVEGNILFQNLGTFEIADSLGDESVAIIADTPSDRDTGGMIVLQNNTTYVGSGEPESNIVLISQNTSSENGGGVTAIEIQNSAEGDIFLYAAHGEILLQNNVQLREATAYKIHAKNSAQVVYETGVGSLLFDSGPSGGFSINRWREVE